jgi:hypothetical protein
MNRRTDYHTALLIDAVLAAREQMGISTSARTLHEIGVPVEVAMRLLTRPWDRRSYKQSDADKPVT